MSTSESDAEQLKAQCQTAASIAVDALMTAGILSEMNSLQAIDIVAEEILVRKVMGKL